MKLRLIRLWEQMRASYWFVPGLMTIGALGLAALLVYLDWLTQHGRFPGLGQLAVVVTDTSEARIVLSTIAGSAITVAGVIFSITIVVLNMASAQFGPRLLRNFMEHTGTQTVLGTYVGSFMYCLVVLSAVRTGDHDAFVPQHAVAAGILLGLLSFGALIYFIHHVSVFIQASRIVDDVAIKLERALHTQFPERAPGDPLRLDEDETHEGAAGTPEFDDSRSRAVSATHSGYLQALDYDGLLRFATERDLVLRLTCRAGQFMLAGRPLAHAAPAENLADSAVAGIVAKFIIGPERTPTQDLEYAVRQLVEIALRALSPGINDPFTAINCVDRLGATLALLGTRELPQRCRRDAEGHIRLIANPSTYRGIVDTAFNQIRQAASGNVAVSLRLLSTITAVGEADLPVSFSEALREQTEAIHELNRDRLVAGRDREDFERYYRGALEMLAHPRTQ